MERQRTVVEGVKIAVDEENAQAQYVFLQPFECHEVHVSPCYRQEIEPGSSPEQRQAILLQHQLSPHELAHQESLIQERESEIREIETGIHELAEIFHDLGTLVDQQGGMLGASTGFHFLYIYLTLSLRQY